MKLSEINSISYCANCGRAVTSASIKLVQPKHLTCLVTTPMMQFKFVDKDGVVRGGADQANAEIGDMLMACPVCGHIHHFGFDIAPRTPVRDPDTYRSKDPDWCPINPAGTHEPDWDTLYTDGDGEECLDVHCKHCGRSGCVDSLSNLTEKLTW